MGGVVSTVTGNNQAKKRRTVTPEKPSRAKRQKLNPDGSTKLEPTKFFAAANHEHSSGTPDAVDCVNRIKDDNDRDGSDEATSYNDHGKKVNNCLTSGNTEMTHHIMGDGEKRQIPAVICEQDEPDKEKFEAISKSDGINEVSQRSQDENSKNVVLITYQDVMRDSEPEDEDNNSENDDGQENDDDDIIAGRRDIVIDPELQNLLMTPSSETVMGFSKFPFLTNREIMLENYGFVEWARNLPLRNNRLEAFVQWSRSDEGKALELEAQGNETFRFGKHKNKTFLQISNIDPHYHERYMNVRVPGKSSLILSW